MSERDTDTDDLEVWIDQDLCTGDGLCVQYAPDVFEFDIDGLAYVKEAGGDILTEAGAAAAVPARLRLDVVDASRDCPGSCIHVRRASDGVEVAGPDAGADADPDNVADTGPDVSAALPTRR